MVLSFTFACLAFTIYVERRLKLPYQVIFPLEALLNGRESCWDDCQADLTKSSFIIYLCPIFFVTKQEFVA